jgi:hypothetical protein
MRNRLPPSGGSSDQTGLCRQSLQNGNIRGYGRRLSAISALNSLNPESRDGIEYAKSPDFGPILASLVAPGGTPECLAEAGGYSPLNQKLKNDCKH